MKTSVRFLYLVVAAVLVGLIAFAVLANRQSVRWALAGPDSARVLYADSLFSWSAATNVAPEIRAYVTPDPEANLWHYSYTVLNGGAATNAIMTFALSPVIEPTGVVEPAHWMSTYGFEDRADALVWTVVDAGPAPVDWDSVSFYPSPYEIAPGDSASGFNLDSRYGPTMVNYYVQGFRDIGAADEPDAPSFFVNSISGATLGPAGTVSVGDSVLSGSRVQLHSPAPNPTARSVSIAYYIPRPADVSLSIYTISGRAVRRVDLGRQPAGLHSLTWNGLDGQGGRVAPGVYFLRLGVDGAPAGQRRVVVLP